MLKWARRQIGMVRESVKYRKKLSVVREARREEDAQVRRNARALGATVADVRRAKSSIPGIIAIETSLGKVHVRPRDTDLLVLLQIIGQRDYDLDNLPQAAKIDARYHEILAAGEVPVIVDAGANIGAASIWFSKRFPEASCVLVEPDPGNAEVARLNAAAIANAKVFEAALGATSGKVKLDTFDDQGWGSRTSRSEEGVPIVTVAELTASVVKGRLFLVKIDIEGFEADVFSQNLGWVDAPAVIILEPHDWMLPGAGTSQSFQKALFGKGRELFLSGENLVFI